MRKSARKWAVISVTSIVVVLSVMPASADERSTAELLKNLEQQIEVLRLRLTELESELHGPGSATVRDSSQEVAEEELTEDQLTTVDEDRESSLASSKSAYLPSRGRSQAMHYGIDRGQLDVHAFIDLDYLDAGRDGSRSGVSTFDNHHANLFLRSEIRPNLLAHAEFEFEHSGEIVEVDQAYLEWAATDWLSLTGPRFYTPFGIERFVWYAPTNLLVSRPQPMRQIIPGNFYANGLMLSGNVGSDKHRFTYEAAVSNGLGEEALSSRRKSRQVRDNNSNRSVSGRISLVVWPAIEIGTSYYTGRYSTEGDLGIDFFGLDLSARWKGFEFRGEYVDATVEQAGGLADHLEDGWYGQLAYLLNWDREFLPKLAFVSRYDSVDLDRSVLGGDDRRLWSWGINATLYRHFHVKSEYRFINEDGVQQQDDEFLTQLVVDF